jgi:hypothetical protein
MDCARGNDIDGGTGQLNTTQAERELTTLRASRLNWRSPDIESTIRSLEAVISSGDECTKYRPPHVISLYA